MSPPQRRSLGLTRNSKRLLATVRNRPHATADDHEDPISSRKSDEVETSANASSAPVSDDFIFAEPKSSSDEADTPEVQEYNPGNLHGGNRKAQNRTASREARQIKIPSSGSYKQGQADKKRRAEAESGLESAKRRRSSPESDSAEEREKKRAEENEFVGQNAFERDFERRIEKNLFAKPMQEHHVKYPRGHLKKTVFTQKNKTINQTESTDMTKRKGGFKLPSMGSAVRGGNKLQGQKERSSAFKTPKELPPESTRKRATFKRQPGAGRDGDVMKDVEDEAPTSSMESKSMWKPPPTLNTQPAQGIKPLTAKDLDPTASQSSSSLSSPSSNSPAMSFSQADPFKIEDDDEDVPGGAICPYCKEQVDPVFLLSFTKGKSRISVAKQAEFCKAHKRKSAEDIYRSRGYPQINWDTLESRFEAQTVHIEDILKNKEPSFYRRQLEAKVDSGKDRTLFQAAGSGAIQGLTPGYYGTRGATMMSQFIGEFFASELRELAPTDRLISAGGISGFIQAVLVPELAMKLIVEDMDCTEDRAREVMKESIELGDVVNEEVDDVSRRTQSFDQSQKLVFEDGSDEE